jgi:outer membrane lipoprotein-sorting protein
VRPSFSGWAPVVALAVVAVVAAACQPAKLRPRLPATTPSAERCLAALAERRAGVQSIRGFAQIAYETGEDNVGARHAVLVRAPDHFRLEVLSPFGALAVIASDARELVVYARREAKIYRGPATAASVGAYTQVPIEVADVTSVLLGMPPQRRPSGPVQVVRDEAVGAFKLVMPVVEGRALVWLEPEMLAPVASETPLGGGAKLRVAFGQYENIGSMRFPHAIDMRAEPGDRVVRVRYASPSINTEVANTLFSFPPRPGLEELVIDQYVAGGGR